MNASRGSDFLLERGMGIATGALAFPLQLACPICAVKFATSAASNPCSSNGLGCEFRNEMDCICGRSEESINEKASGCDEFCCDCCKGSWSEDADFAAMEESTCCMLLTEVI